MQMQMAMSAAEPAERQASSDRLNSCERVASCRLCAVLLMCVMNRNIENRARASDQHPRATKLLPVIRQTLRQYIDCTVSAMHPRIGIPMERLMSTWSKALEQNVV